LVTASRIWRGVVAKLAAVCASSGQASPAACSIPLSACKAYKVRFYTSFGVMTGLWLGYT
jgi:hypothetical protein